jgi:multidrug transporter EmrE-like cation transporter
MNLLAFIYIVLGVSLCLTGDTLLKKSSALGDASFWVGITFYAASALPVALVFRRMEFVWVFIAWEAATLLLSALIGTFYFHENLSSYKIVALLLALAAVVISGLE